MTTPSPAIAGALREVSPRNVARVTDDKYRSIRAGALPGRSSTRTGGTLSFRRQPTAENETELIERYRDRLRLFAARRLRDWSAAEDVAQEALRRTLKALRGGRISNMDALPAFLYQTALHICQHRARSAGREERALRRFASDERTDPPDLADPLQAVLSSERRAQVRQALEKLEESDRVVLSLSYVEALETAEIARRLQLTDGHVRVRRHRALKRLAELLGVTRGANRVLKK